MKRKEIKLISLIIVVSLFVGLLLFKFEDINHYRLKENLKIALLLSENLSTCDVENHSSAVNKLSESYKIGSDKILIKEKVVATECFNIVEETVDNGYNLIFAVGKEVPCMASSNAFTARQPHCATSQKYFPLAFSGFSTE